MAGGREKMPLRQGPVLVGGVLAGRQGELGPVGLGAARVGEALPVSGQDVLTVRLPRPCLVRRGLARLEERGAAARDALAEQLQLAVGREGEPLRRLAGAGPDV